MIFAVFWMQRSTLSYTLCLYVFPVDGSVFDCNNLKKFGSDIAHVMTSSHSYPRALAPS